jgi:hypothetical protein
LFIGLPYMGCTKITETKMVAPNSFCIEQREKEWKDTVLKDTITSYQSYVIRTDYCQNSMDPHHQEAISILSKKFTNLAHKCSPDYGHFHGIAKLRDSNSILVMFNAVLGFTPPRQYYWSEGSPNFDYCTSNNNHFERLNTPSYTSDFIGYLSIKHIKFVHGKEAQMEIQTRDGELFTAKMPSCSFDYYFYPSNSSVQEKVPVEHFPCFNYTINDAAYNDYDDVFEKIEKDCSAVKAEIEDTGCDQRLEYIDEIDFIY